MRCQISKASISQMRSAAALYFPSTSTMGGDPRIGENAARTSSAHRPCTRTRANVARTHTTRRQRSSSSTRPRSGMCHSIYGRCDPEPARLMSADIVDQEAYLDGNIRRNGQQSTNPSRRPEADSRRHRHEHSTIPRATTPCVRAWAAVIHNGLSSRDDGCHRRDFATQQREASRRPIRWWARLTPPHRTRDARSGMNKVILTMDATHNSFCDGTPSQTEGEDRTLLPWIAMGRNHLGAHPILGDYSIHCKHHVMLFQSTSDIS